MAPHGDVVKTQLVPPPVEHGLIESKNAFLRHGGRRRYELAQLVVYPTSLLVIDTRQEMPEGEGIAFASFIQHDRDILRALLRRSVFKIESRQRSAEFCG